MNISDMRNTIVLKNLPSNLIDEAIVVLKANKKIKKSMYLREQNNKGERGEDNKEDYIVREAEMIVSNYISDIEIDEMSWNMKMIKKNKRLKLATGILAVICWIELIGLLI